METNGQVSTKSSGSIKNLITSKRSLFVLSLVTVLALAGLVAHLVVNSQTLDSKEIQKIVQERDCKQALKDIGSKHSDSSNNADSIALLSFKGSCEISLGKYQDAVVTYQSLNTYYKKTHNTELMKNTDATIAYAKNAITNPPPKPVKQSLNDQKLEQYLKDQGGQ